MKRLLMSILSAAITFLTISCSQPIAGGGGSEVEVVGSVFLSGNDPAPATQVKLIPYDFDPSVMAAIGDSLIDTSDNEGRYSFKNVAPGKYNILAVQLIQRTRMLVTGINVDSGVTTVEPETLREPGAIKMMLLGATTHNGYATIPGTDIAAFVAAYSREIRLDSVPPGSIPEVRYTILGDTVTFSRKDVDVEAAATTLLTDPWWQHRRQLLLNTSATGAGVGGDIYGFPVLIRLGEGNFDFTQAKTDGSDLRFTDASGSPLPCEIEQWDAAARLAAAWVKVDTVRGNDSTQSITMHWGASASSATQKSDGSAVFDTSAGFAGVWHLNEAGNETALDATAHLFSGTAYAMAGNGLIPGAIGNARSFDGSSSYIVMHGTAGSALNFPEDGQYTMSAWVYADTFDHVFRTILTKGYEQYFLQLSYFPGDKALWQFSTFKESATWNMSHTPATEKQWVLLTGVRQENSQSLYVNGELVLKSSATDAVYPHPDVTIPRNTTNDFTIGRFLQEATYPMDFGFCFFKGKIDEVRACSVARSADWIKLCYMNQKSDDKLVQFKQ